MKRLAAMTVLGAGLLLRVSGVGAADYPADNSGTNVRDRDPAALTAGSQSNATPDVRITQEIRKAVLADKTLSTNAHNIKIITADGVVTLRGPVKTTDEKASIEAKAHAVSGVTRVDNEIEIASN